MVSSRSYSTLPILLFAFLLSLACGEGPPTPQRIPTTLELSLPKTTFSLGEVATAEAKVFDQEGQQMTGVAVSWTSSASEVISVEFGRLTARTRGDATITAQVGELSDTVSVTVISTGSLFGWSCAGADPDVGDVLFETTHPLGAEDHACLIVDSSEGHPVRDGRRAFRFQLDPGDCSGNSGFNDCEHDRNRTELHDTTATGSGNLAVYEQSIFIPAQPDFKPAGTNGLFLGQITLHDRDFFLGFVNLTLNDAGELRFRLHEGFTTIPLDEPLITDDLFDRWLDLRYEIVWSPEEDVGRIAVFLDGVEKVRVNRATLPSAAATAVVRIGLYNAFLSQAQEPYPTQVVYYDGVRKTVIPAP